jgi:hypothetical protein
MAIFGAQILSENGMAIYDLSISSPAYGNISSSLIEISNTFESHHLFSFVCLVWACFF